MAAAWAETTSAAGDLAPEGHRELLEEVFGGADASPLALVLGRSCSRPAVTKVAPVMPNRSFEADTHREGTASRAREHKSCGALAVRAGQLQR